MNVSEMTDEQLINKFNEITRWGKNCSNKQLGIAASTQAKLQKELARRGKKIISCEK